MAFPFIIAGQLAAGIVQGLIANRNVPQITQQNAAPVEQAVQQEVNRAVIPVIENLTNNEPWYRSRVTWGNIVSSVCFMLAAFGVTVTPDNQVSLMEILPAAGVILGNLYSLYGRWAGRKAMPLGVGNTR